MNITETVSILKDICPGSDIRENEPMSAHTTFRVGGPADIWCAPVTCDALIALLEYARSEQIHVTVIGKGSNLLVRDGGIRGIVVETTALSKIEKKKENILLAESGASLANLAIFARDCGLSGLEFAQGIPGTVGGAVYMNAGAYGGEIGLVARLTEYVTFSGAVGRLVGKEHRFGYRSSAFSDRDDIVILRTEFELEKGNIAAITEEMNDYRRRRKATQPLEYPSAGSTFKRPEGYFAGKLIMDSGLRGYTSGGAQVSEKHAGFVINCGGATCQDVLEVMRHVVSTVKEKFGVTLEPEVKIIGDN